MNSISSGFSPGVSRAAFMSRGGHATRRHPASRPNELPPVSADSWPETIVGVSQYPKKNHGMTSTSTHHYSAHNRRPQWAAFPFAAG
ncbi:MAG: hypothetical protein ACFN1A_08440 [Corynebacterium matruchotii]|uniref:hypothetical protein n=1 Tax=Corynebacterium matruchotii TaxID=43768 RepID=UPI003613B98C